jgi:hypothetical protein
VELIRFPEPRLEPRVWGSPFDVCYCDARVYSNLFEHVCVARIYFEAWQRIWDMTEAAAADQFDAFISYRQIDPDRIVAKSLHVALESYRLPKGDGPPRTIKIFRDVDELAASEDLGAAITDALKVSRFLIVICSPAARESLWIAKEIREFRRLRSGGTVLAVLIAGTPETAFPLDLLQAAAGDEAFPGFHEPLAVDLRAETRRALLGRISREKLRLLAPLLDRRYDDLVRREEVRRIARLRRTVTASAIAAAIFLALAGVAVYQAIVARRARADERSARILTLEEQSRRDFTEGAPGMALASLDEAYRLGAKSPTTRFLLRQQMRLVDSNLVSVRSRQDERAPILPRANQLSSDPSAANAQQLVQLLQASARTYLMGYSVLETAFDGDRFLFGHSDLRVFAIGKGIVGVVDDPHDPKQIGIGHVTRSAHLSRDGRWVVTYGSGSPTKVWRADGGGFVCSVEASEEVFFLLQGEQILTTGPKGLVRWSTATCEASSTWMPSQPLHRLIGVDHTPFGDRAAFSTDDGSLVVIEPATWTTVGEAKPKLRKADMLPGVLYFSRGEIVARHDGRISRWSVGKNGLNQESGLDPHPEYRCMAQDEDATFIAACDRHSVRVMLRADAEEREVAVIDVPDGASSVSLVRGRLFIDDRAGAVRVYDLPSLLGGVRVQRAQQIESVHFCGDSKVVLRIPGGRRALVDLRGNDVALLGTEQEKIASALCSRDGGLVVSAMADGGARVWSGADGSMLTKLEGPRFDEMNGVFELNRSGDRLLARDESGRLVLWRTRGQGEPAILRGTEKDQAGFSTDGHLVAWRADDRLSIRDSMEGKIRDELPASAFHSSGPPGTAVAGCDVEGLFRVWTGTPPSPRVLPRRTSVPMPPVFSLDGSLLLTPVAGYGFGSQSVIWDVQSGELVGSAEGLPAATNASDMTPGGTRFLVRNGPHIDIVETRGGRLLRSYPSASEVGAGEFSPDGTHLAVRVSNHAVDIWDVGEETRPPEDVERIVAERLPFNFRNGVARATADPRAHFTAPSHARGAVY